MTKLSKRPVDSKLMGFYVNNLWSAFTLMATKDEIRDLFRDLFTHTEYKMFAKRLEIARRLLEGQKYESIMEDLKVTEKTISSVSNILAEKGNGFRTANQRLKDLENHYQKKREERQDRLERRKRKKLPAETFLFDAIGAGFSALDKAVSKRIKRNSATKQL